MSRPFRQKIRTVKFTNNNIIIFFVEKNDNIIIISKFITNNLMIQLYQSVNMHLYQTKRQT